MEGFLETTYDKFIFRVKEGFLYLKEDFWVKVEGNSALMGISDFLQKARGDVAFLETVDARKIAQNDRKRKKYIRNQ